MNRGANSTEALRKYPTFARIATAQNGFESAPHGATRPSLLDAATIDLDVDAQVAFNASHRVDRDAGHRSPFCSHLFPHGAAAPV